MTTPLTTALMMHQEPFQDGPTIEHHHHHTTLTPTTTQNRECGSNKELLNEQDGHPMSIHCGAIGQEEKSMIEKSNHLNTTSKNCDEFICELYKTIMAKKFDDKSKYSILKCLILFTLND